MRYVRIPALLGLLAVLAGCGGQNKINRGGEVNGKVTINNKPVTAGRVLLVSADGIHSASGALRGDGTYTVKEPPMGECKIAVETAQFKGAPRPTTPRGGKARQNSSPGMVLPDSSEVGLAYVAIPAKYEKVDTSGLSYTVPKGNSSHDLPLTK
jgi:hypothetical protein